MHKIAENGIITITAGDSLIAPIYLFLSDSSSDRYTLTGTDRVLFSIQAPNQPFERGEVRKILTTDDLDENGDLLLILKPTDTQCLPAGLYYYEAKLQITRNGSEYIDTVIPKRKFYIL